MSQKTNTPVLDLSLTGGFLVVAGLFLYAARDIPPPFFDPLGSAAVPQTTAWALVGLALAIGTRAVLALRAGQNPPRSAQASNRGSAPLLRGLSVIAISGVYLAIMQYSILGYTWATLIYVSLLGSLLSKFEKLPTIGSIGLAVILSFGGNYLFTEFFYIDLPQ